MTVSSANIGIVLLHYINPHISDGHATCVEVCNDPDGSAPTIAGQSIANPMAAVLTAGMMLGWLGHPALEVQVEKAVAACLHSDTVSAELGGSFSTSEVGDAILRELDKLN